MVNDDFNENQSMWIDHNVKSKKHLISMIRPTLVYIECYNNKFTGFNVDLAGEKLSELIGQHGFTVYFNSAGKLLEDYGITMDG